MTARKTKKPTRAVVAGWMEFQSAWGASRQWLDLYGLCLSTSDGNVSHDKLDSLHAIERSSLKLAAAARKYREAMERQEGMR